MFAWFEGGQLKGFVYTHVDDFLWSGDKTFESNTIQQLRKRFPIGEETIGDFVYVGVRIRSVLDGGGNLTEILMDQEDYVEEIKEAEFNRDFGEDVLLGKGDHRTYRGIVGSLLWAASMTRPDISLM